MSDGGASPEGDPTDDVLPDLSGGTGWDDPLPDLADTAPVGRLVDLGAGGAGADESPAPTLELDGELPDLTLGGGGSGGRRGRRRLRAGRTDAGRLAGDDDADLLDDGRDAAGGDDEGGGAARTPRRPRRRPRVSLADAVRPASSLLDGPADRADADADPGAPSGSPVVGGAEADPPATTLFPDLPLPAVQDDGLIFGPTGDASVEPPPTPTEGRGRRGRKDRRKAAGDGVDAPAHEERPLTAEERLQHALKLAYRHLTKRDRTVSEVRAHLEKREIDESSIAAALAELVEFRYLDDERYAARFVEDKRRLEGWGHLRIEQGLRRTGVPKELADRALADDPLRDDEDELAVEALDRRLAGRALEDDGARQKALRLLATKGYALDTAYTAVRAYQRRCDERGDA